MSLKYIGWGREPGSSKNHKEHLFYGRPGEIFLRTACGMKLHGGHVYSKTRPRKCAACERIEANED